VLAMGVHLAALPVIRAREPVYSLTDKQKEQFLLRAKVIRTKGTARGITGVVRATLGDGTITHDAAIQCIDESKARFDSARGPELNFRDTYKYNIAAYRLDRMLGLKMTPPTVERSYSGKQGAFCWWVDHVLMDELERSTKKRTAPDVDFWNKQIYIVRVFDQLIFNTDRNLGNLIIDKNWRVWMIDHSRAFRMHRDLLLAKNLVKCERRLLAELRGLTEESIAKEMGNYLNRMEIEGLLARRDKIVAIFDKMGPSALYDLPPAAG
jgi:hypothetical protein